MFILLDKNCDLFIKSLNNDWKNLNMIYTDYITTYIDFLTLFGYFDSIMKKKGFFPKM